MAEFHFIRPWFLLAILPVFLVSWLLLRKQREESAWGSLMDSHLLKHLIVGKEMQQKIRPIYVMIMLWVLTVVALSGPTWKRQPSPFADDQAGLVMILKLSESMEATDVQPSRLERAKFKMHDLLESRQGAASALIVYSGSAHLVMPLTKDDGVITSMAEGLTPAVMPSKGDALADAIGLAEQLLKDAGVPGSVVVFADTVDASQANTLAQVAPSLPVQFMSIQPTQSPVDSGMQSAAQSRGSEVIVMTDDSSDVEKLSSISKSKFLSVAGADGSERWQDAGYWLLPFMLCGSALWFRKGWR